MLGDMLFYAVEKSSIFDELIAWYTKSPIVHVAIDIGDSTKIEALAHGIARTPYAPPYRTWSYGENTKDADINDLNGAKQWLVSMVGRKYGWSDVISASEVFKRFIYTVRPGYYDCSALACEFLIKAGGVELGELGLDPHLATPASLALQLGVK